MNDTDMEILSEIETAALGLRIRSFAVEQITPQIDEYVRADRLHLLKLAMENYKTSIFQPGAHEVILQLIAFMHTEKNRKRKIAARRRQKRHAARSPIVTVS